MTSWLYVGYDSRGSGIVKLEGSKTSGRLTLYPVYLVVPASDSTRELLLFLLLNLWVEGSGMSWTV